MALSFAVVIAPNAWWLVHHDFMPFHYVDARAKAAAHWYQYLTYPLQWTGSQNLLPAAHDRPACASLCGQRSAGRARWRAVLLRPALCDRDGLGPFAVTTLVAAPLGRLPVAMWGYPLWSFVPLAVIVWLGPIDAPRPLMQFARG